MWLYNPGDPHTTPTGWEFLLSAPFNINVPAYWRLKYRPDPKWETDPGGPSGMIPYDLILAFDYPNIEDIERGDKRHRWVTAYAGERDDSVWAGAVPLIQSVDGRPFDEVLLHFTNIGGFHNYHGWRLHVDGDGWFLSENNKDNALVDQYGTGNDAIYSIEDIRYPGTPADSYQGNDRHCHFDGLGENKFIYKYDTFPGSFGENEEQIKYPWRPDITIEPYWP